jgi:hypothetical protein
MTQGPPAAIATEAAGTGSRQGPPPSSQGQHQQQQPKSPLTFDDLLPLLTSQHRTNSSTNNDALMLAYDTFTRHGERVVLPLRITLWVALLLLLQGTGQARQCTL